MKDFSVFVDTIYSIEDKLLLEDFLIGITTPKERDELCRRLAIVDQLLSGVPQQKIAANLKVGVATVTRGSKELSLDRFKAIKQVHALKNSNEVNDKAPWQPLN